MEEDHIFKGEEELGNLVGRLRDVYLLYKEIRNRHSITMDPRIKERIHKLVYSSKQSTIYLKHPDAQRRFREEIIEKIAEIPSPKPIPLYPDTLLSDYFSLKLKNTPPEIRETLAEFSFSRILFLQQYKYKFLLKWAFFSQHFPTLVTISQVNEKLQSINLLVNDYISKYERLRYDEEFPGSENRPSPKTDEGTNLFLEEPTISYSSISRDDIKDFLSVNSQRLHDERIITRYLLRLKWLWVFHRTEIWKRSMELLANLKKKSIERMKLLTGSEEIGKQKIVVRMVTNINLRNLKRQKEMMKRAQAVHSTFAEEHLNLNEDLLNSNIDTIDSPPTLIVDVKQLQGLLDNLSKEFGLVGDLQLDDGHSLSYQVAHLLPEFFELQRQRLDWYPYNNEEEKEKAGIRYENLKNLKVHRLTAIRKAYSLSEQGGSSSIASKSIKIVSAKMPDWIHLIKLIPEVPIWYRRQKAKLAYLERNDQLLETAFNILDVQDLPTINKVLEEFSLTYAEKASKKGVLKTEIGITDNDLKKKYFSSLLRERTVANLAGEEDLIELPTQCIKALYTLKLLKSRNLKQKLIDMLNVYRSIQRRLSFDISDLGSREQLKPDAELDILVKDNTGHNPTVPSPKTVNSDNIFDKVPSLFGRRDQFEYVENEIYVKDDQGEYVAYTVILDDYKEIEKELIKLGSYYILQYECWCEDEGNNYPSIDRDFLVGELLDLESKFQEAKLELIMTYMEIYEHAIEKETQLKVAQEVINLMALRPRLYLKASYFTQSYWAHISAIEEHNRLLVSILTQQRMFFHVKDVLDINPALSKISQILPTMQRCVDELYTIYETETPLALSTLEQASWEFAQKDWKYSQCTSLVLFEEGVLIDKAELVMECAKELGAEVKTGNWRLLPVLNQTPTDKKNVELNIPSELQICCNLMEAWRYRKSLEQAIEETNILEELYKKQCITMKKDNTSLDSAEWNLGLRHIAEVDDGPGSRTDFWIPAFEFDPKLKANLHFASVQALKALMLPCGICEIKAAALYQTMHKHLLMIAIQTNQNALDKWTKNIAEIELARDFSYIPKKTKAIWSNVLGRRGEGLLPEKAEAEIQRLKSRISGEASKFFLDIKIRKMRHRVKVENAYKRIAEKYKQILDENDHLPLVLRNVRANLIDGYCKEVLRDVYHDAIKIQIIKILHEYRRMMKIVPSNVYQEQFEGIEDELRPRVFVGEDGEIVNIEHIPSTEEILAMKGFKEEDSHMWTDWNPFSSAEVLDLSTGKIKNMTLGLIPREKETTLLQTKNNWRFPSPVKTALETIIACVQILQVKFFIYLLGENSEEVMDLQDTTIAGYDFWKIDEQKSEEEISHKAVDDMLSAQSPKYSLEEDIKRGLGSLKGLATQFLVATKGEKPKICVMQSKKVFQVFASALYQSLHHSLMHEKKEDAIQVSEFMTMLFRLNRKNFVLKNKEVAPLFSNPDCDVIDACERIVYIDNDNRDTFLGQVSGAYMWDLEWGLLEVSSEERNHTLATTTAMSLSITSYISSKQLMKSKAPLKSLEITLTYLQPELESWRLKCALFMWRTDKDIVTDPVVYEKISAQYRDTLEWVKDTQLPSGLSREDRELLKLQNEVKLLKDTFQSLICSFAIKFIEGEVTSLTEASQAAGQYGVKQDFTCNIDNNYTDSTRKIGILHNYLNTLRNRCTIVEAPTCGKALVFSIKDLTQLTKRFADQLQRYAEAEFRAREEATSLEYQQLLAQLRQKENEIMLAKRNIDNLNTNMDNLVNAQLSQKGNQLIYELDISHRQLQEIKNNMKLLEHQIREIVLSEYRQQIQEKDREIADLKQAFKSYRDEVSVELKTDIDSQKAEALNEIKSKPTSKVKIQAIDQVIEENDTSTKERRKKELVLLQETIRKMRTMHQWARLRMNQNFEKHIQDLREQLSSNQYLWEQLNESQRREALLKQELSYTQQALAAAEKLADKLQTQIEDMNSQRLQLQQYKANKGKRLAELEEKMKLHQRLEFVDNYKLMNQFQIQNKKLQVMKSGEIDAGKQYLHHHNAYNRKIQDLKLKLKSETKLKLEAYDQLNMIKEEMEGIDQDPESMATIWRNRYYDLLEEVKDLKGQNIGLRDKLIDIGEGEFVDKHEDLVCRAKSSIGEALPSIFAKTPQRANLSFNSLK
ncbi:unnamed protein product [Blepharisma stoltei]|uniref:Uncharacterized protein n=1 Tax=Blepharisma stoltei TaxID=1481888 RepID=A0AAU9I706_9CILI|nr:unnamed protein product [Blepharisma stoltei]